MASGRFITAARKALFFQVTNMRCEIDESDESSAYSDGLRLEPEVASRADHRHRRRSFGGRYRRHRAYSFRGVHLLMHADLFRDLYAYHFALNRKIWDVCIVPLTDEQFTRKVNYSVGSVRNQVVHVLNIDDRWFSGLRGEPVPGFLNPVHFYQRPIIRAKWDGVEARMRAYLDQLQDANLMTQPFLAQDKDPTALWQILLHVANHGTDHRAQLLRILHDLGATTFPQDYIIYTWEHRS